MKTEKPELQKVTLAKDHYHNGKLHAAGTTVELPVDVIPHVASLTLSAPVGAEETDNAEAGPAARKSKKRPGFPVEASLN